MSVKSTHGTANGMTRNPSAAPFQNGNGPPTFQRALAPLAPIGAGPFQNGPPTFQRALAPLAPIDVSGDANGANNRPPGEIRQRNTEVGTTLRIVKNATEEPAIATHGGRVDHHVEQHHEHAGNER